MVRFSELNYSGFYTGVIRQIEALKLKKKAGAAFEEKRRAWAKQGV